MNSWISPFLYHKTSQYYQKINLWKNESKNIERPHQQGELSDSKEEWEWNICLNNSNQIEMRGLSIGNTTNEEIKFKENSTFKTANSWHMNSHQLYNAKVIVFLLFVAFV